MNKGKSKLNTETLLSSALDISDVKPKKGVNNSNGIKMSDAELLKELEELIKETKMNITDTDQYTYEISPSISNDMDKISSNDLDTIDEESIIKEATMIMNQITLSEQEVHYSSTEDDNLEQDSPLLQELDNIITISKELKSSPPHIEILHKTKSPDISTQELDKSKPIQLPRDKFDTLSVEKNSRMPQSRVEHHESITKPKSPKKNALRTVEPRVSNINVSTNKIDEPTLLRLKSTAEAKQRLEHQIKLATQLSYYYLHKANKQDADKTKALEMHNIKKQSQRSLELIDSLSNIEENDPITVIKQQIQYEQEEELLDIPPNRIRVVVDRVTGLDDLMLASGIRESSLSPPTTFLQITLPSHIDDKDSQSYTSSIIKDSFHPQYTTCIALFQTERSKSFLKFLERKKLIIEVIQSRGFFRKNIVLGKALVPLHGILEQCNVIFDALEIIPEQPSKHKSRAKIHGSISVRIPFDMNHKNIIKEEFIQVDERFVSFSPVVTVPHVKVTDNKKITDKNMLIGLNDKVDIENQFYDARSIMSNLVIEKELEEMDGMLSSGNNERLRTIRERKESYELQKQIIVCQVEAGILTPYAYVSALHDAIMKEKKRALLCRKMNRLDLSKKRIDAHQMDGTGNRGTEYILTICFINTISVEP